MAIQLLQECLLLVGSWKDLALHNHFIIVVWTAKMMRLALLEIRLDSDQGFMDLLKLRTVFFQILQYESPYNFGKELRTGSISTNFGPGFSCIEFVRSAPDLAGWPSPHGPHFHFWCIKDGLSRKKSEEVLTVKDESIDEEAPGSKGKSNRSGHNLTG